MNTNTDNTSTRGRLEICRATAHGDGCAMRMEVYPAHGASAGHVACSMCMQTQKGFTWHRGATIGFELGRRDLSQVIQVLRGMQESVNDGNGLWINAGELGWTVVKFRHVLEPRPGYIREAACEGRLARRMFLDMDDALTLMLALERALYYVCFGVPQV